MKKSLTFFDIVFAIHSRKNSRKRSSHKLKKVSLILCSVLLILANANIVSALSWSNINNTSAYIDNSGTLPPSNGWFQLQLPSWYDASQVTLFKITLQGHGDNSNSNIDVWVSHSLTHSNPIQIASFNAPLSVNFNQSWQLPVGTVNYSFFSGSPSSFYVGYGCHFWHDSTEVKIEQRDVPEPATIFLFGSSLIGLVGIRRKLMK
jgi:hypothetical protein